MRLPEAEMTEDEQVLLCVEIGAALLNYLHASVMLGHRSLGSTWRYIAPVDGGSMIVHDVVATMSSDPSVTKADASAARGRLEWLAGQWAPVATDWLEARIDAEVGP